MGPDQQIHSEAAEDQLGELMGFLARECGWDKDFIAEKFTVDQLKKYVEVLNQQRKKDYETQTYCFLMAVGYAFGSIKAQQFHDFISQFQGKKAKIEDTISKMKSMGLPVEEN